MTNLGHTETLLQELDALLVCVAEARALGNIPSVREPLDRRIRMQLATVSRMLH